MSSATDTAIIEAADRDRRVDLSAETDFGTILALTARTSPSVLLLRLTSPRRTDAIAALLEANLRAVTESFHAGAVVVVEDDRVRIRALPLR